MIVLDFACHTEGEEKFPAKPVAPAANIEWEEDGHCVLCDGDDVVKTDNLGLNISVDLVISVFFYVGAILNSQVEFLL